MSQRENCQLQVVSVKIYDIFDGVFLACTRVVTGMYLFTLLGNIPAKLQRDPPVLNSAAQ
jgi:hypothetical protein